MDTQPLFQLLRNQNFMLVWWAGLISFVGNYMLFVALPVYVYGETGSALATGISVVATALPNVLVGQVAGVLVDRWDYRRTMLTANLLLVPVTLLFLGVTSAPWWLVVPVAFIQSSVGQFLGPAENALLPTLVAKERLGAANSLNALNNNLARLVGPALGGLLIAGLGFAGVVVVDALTYLMAALLIIGVRERSRTTRNKPDERERSTQQSGNPYQRLATEWQDGLAAVKKNRLLMLSFVAAALVGFGEGFISTLLAPFVEVMLGGGGPELGYIFSAQAVGGITAGLLLTAYADRISPTKLLAWGGLFSGLLLIPIFNYPLVYPVLWPIMGLTALAGLPFAAWGTAQMTLLQSEAEPGIRGRIFASYFAVFGLFQIIGMMVSGYLGDTLGVMVINVDAGTYLLAGGVVLFTARRIRQVVQEVG